MRPLLHPTMVNGRTGDPALYIETLFERRAILFDLGDITSLSARKIQRLERVFISHAHIDHFIGFDRLLRVLVGRDKKISLYGPQGFIDHIHHKLQGYRWNLVHRYPSELIFFVTEIGISLACRTARFRLKNAFTAELLGDGHLAGGVVYSEPSFKLSTAVLEHQTPCLGFASRNPRTSMFGKIGSQNWLCQSGHGCATLSAPSSRTGRMIIQSEHQMGVRGHLKACAGC